ncbi:arylsulfatase [Sphingobium sp. OAS761]|uniref:arylsulfatase n=1 Tax=Sphingobium sp. OAS761 TaxID=2817901 RepID=UPI00209E6A08|nr:arylsulfatase [Sphingobium sp. OAS761]MCP1470611.1 arylsulfatase [Sphingobium sp. OAS761]
MRRWSRFTALWTTAGLSLATVQAAEPDRTSLPISSPAYSGRLGETYRDTDPPQPHRPVTAPAGAPNILLVLTDDVGFAAASTFGGPVPTPNLDRLARNGLRYTRFHTTAMCSPTRAALLTGRNAQAAHSGIVTDSADGYPGYDGRIPRSAASIGRILTANGYNSAWIGKHHNVPASDQGPAGPFDLWPSGLGFEHFYGFIGGDTNQWQPRLYRGHEAVADQPPPGETLDHLLVDDAVNWLHQQQAAAPGKPFFLYLAPGSAHAPHQAPKAWIDRFKGHFDAGWDALREASLKRQIASGIAPPGTRLTARPSAIPAWSSLSPDEKRADARMMEVYAAMLAYQDAQIGRLLDEMERMGVAEDTLVIFIEGDNGASAEGTPEGSMNELGTMANGVKESAESKIAAIDEMGGPRSYQLFPVGWAWATNAPFQWTKQIASHLGGTRNGMVISWPEKIRETGGVRTEFGHVVDIVPTILEVTGIPAPSSVDGVTQQPLAGVSLAYSFAASAKERPRTQYFEMLGNRALYRDGWWANTVPARLPWTPVGTANSPADYRWELYDLRSDFSQSKDVSAAHRDLLADMQRAWAAQARANNVYPLDDRLTRSGPVPAPPRNRYDYWGAGISVAQPAAPALGIGSWTLDTDIVVPNDGASGAIVATGSLFGGWSFYLDQGRPTVVHAASQQEGDSYRVAGSVPLKAGPSHLRFDFRSRGMMRGGFMTISVDNAIVAQGDIGRTALFMAGLGETFDTGRDTGAPVVDYGGPSEFPGEIRHVAVRRK